jgi:cytochrome c-type biogenesis protein CcmE
MPAALVARREGFFMQTRMVLGAATILVSLAAIAVVTYFQNNEAYYTVDELVGNPALYAAGHAGVVEAAAQAPVGAPVGRRVQVRGEIDRATVERAEEGLELRFVLRYRDQALPVVYEGLVPDTFEQAEEVSVAGRVTDAGVFVADQLFVQCPSKYEAVPPGESAARPALGDG